MMKLSDFYIYYNNEKIKNIIEINLIDGIHTTRLEIKYINNNGKFTRINNDIEKFKFELKDINEQKKEGGE